MTRFKIELATLQDDSDLRKILREVSMGRAVSITLRKEPSFFNALSVEGRFNQVVVGRNVSEGNVVGFGVRSIKPCYLNGEVMELGYLGGLRLLKEFRGSTLTCRGYSFFRELHQDRRTPFYLTTIIEDNENAKKLLTVKREGMPEYADLGLFQTFILKVSKSKLECSKNIVRASKDNLEDMVEFIQDEGKNKQFFPLYMQEDFLNKEGILRGLDFEDVFLYMRSGKIEGVMACWNQHSFKQTHIEKYGLILQFFKPLINFANQARGYSPVLPKEGERLNYSTGALVVIRDNNLVIFNDLINAVHNRALEYKNNFFNVGLHSNDSLLDVVKFRSSINFKSRLYTVTWEDKNKILSELDSKVPYLELGAL